MSGEAFTPGMEDMLWIFLHVKPNTEHAEHVTNLSKKVAEHAIQGLVSKDQLSVETFTEDCCKLEAAQRVRLEVYHRLPSITLSAFIPAGTFIGGDFCPHIPERLHL